MNPGSSLCWSLDLRAELGLRLRKGHSPACTAAGSAPGAWRRSSVWPGRSGGEDPGPGRQIVAQLESGLLQWHTMDASGGKERIKWTTTIIISSSLKTYEIATALENRSHRVRYSDTLERGSIVFSLSVWGPRSDSAYENSPFLGAAFLLMDAKECMISAEEIFLTKIDKFINMHQNCFLVLFAPLHGPEEWNLMFRIHQRFLGSNLRILPVHNTVNAVDLMCTIAKTTSKPTIDSICYRMITTKAYIIEQSPVWRTLQKIKLSTDSVSPNSEY